MIEITIKCDRYIDAVAFARALGGVDADIPDLTLTKMVHVNVDQVGESGKSRHRKPKEKA